MSTTSKQDRQGSRTPADLERKYDLGSMGDRFAEVMGIALDAQTHSEAALDAIGQTNSVVAKISEEVDRISITVKDLDEGTISNLSTRVGVISASVSAIDKNVNSAEFVIGIINKQSTAKISADRLDIVGKTLDIKVEATNIKGKLIADQIEVEDLSALGATIGGWTINPTNLSGSHTGGLGETYETQFSPSALKFSETATSGKETSVSLTSNGIDLHKESLYGVTDKFPFLTLYLADGVGVTLYVDQYGAVSGAPFGGVVPI